MIQIYSRLLATTLLITCLATAVSAQEGAAGNPNSNRVGPPNSPPMLLAHYMPWFVAPPKSPTWGWHWTMNHFDPEQISEEKRQIASQFYPLIDPYDSSDTDVLEYQLLLMRIAGIDGVIVDWYGLTDQNDYAILHRNTTAMLQMCEKFHMKFVICYEDQTVPILEKAGRIAPGNRVQHVAGEIDWLNQYWFQSPAYVRVDGKPLMLSFGNAGLTDEQWGRCIDALDFPIAYISQNVQRPGGSGAFDWPVPTKGLTQVDQFVERVSEFPIAIPAVYPRFVDIYAEAGVQEGYPDIQDNQAATLKQTFKQALAVNAPVLQLVTWNDWGEGTQIEPSREHGYRDLEFVQRVKRWLDRDFRFQERDLRMPAEILRLRRTNHTEEHRDQLGAAVESILKQDVPAARELVKAIGR